MVVGLGNPGADHERDRHNVGFWFVEGLASAAGAVFRADAKLGGASAQLQGAGPTLRLLKPGTFMNRSGDAVRRALDYYRLTAAQLLVVHDDLDLPPGVARLKSGGGHGGHNGLRDIIAHCGEDFLRLRIGIGHPGRKEQVIGYVLRPPGRDDEARIREALDAAADVLPVLVRDGLERAMTRLHTATAPRPAPDFGPAG